MLRVMGGYILSRRGFTLRLEANGYRVWSRVVPGTEPLIFFPGVGAGVVPYIWFLAVYDDRTVFAVEVPNMSGHSTSSCRHATGKSLRELFHSLVLVGTPVSVVAHSLGTIHAAMIVNALPPHTIDSLVLMDPFCHPIHTSRTLSIVFGAVNAGANVSSMRRYFLRHGVGCDIGIQTFAHGVLSHTIVLHQPEKCRSILNIVSAADTILSDSYDETMYAYLRQTHQYVHIVPGEHGSPMRRRHAHLTTDFFRNHTRKEK